MAPGNDNTLPNACVAIQELTQIIEKSTASTLMGLEKELAEAAQAIRASNPTSISLAAGCELFVRYVTRTQALEFADLHTVKQWLIQRGRQFGETSLKARLARSCPVPLFAGTGCQPGTLSRCSLSVHADLL